ncbi:MAG TPA: hypothetical protein VFR23_19000 [Jiangellaceae bacterium]|nr:hypothetical protein [Jiangellaceae bacterium]
MACGPAGYRGEARLEKGSAVARYSVARPRWPVVGRGEEAAAVMVRVIIGVDPHKRSVTFEARDARDEPS